MSPSLANDRKSDRKTVILVYLCTLLGALALLAGVFLAPHLKSLASSREAKLLYTLFSPLCHQIPERCFHFKGFPLAVCGRCLGIYFGFLAGVVIYPLVRGFSSLGLPRGRIFFIVTIPLAIDGTGGLFGFWSTPILLRFAIGFFWALVLPFYFIPGVSDALLKRRKRRNVSPPEIPQSP